MSMVEVSHRASEALQKPSMHETAGHKSRLWIFDQVSSARLRGSKKRTHRAALGTTANWAFCEIGRASCRERVESKAQAGTAWEESGGRYEGGVGRSMWRAAGMCSALRMLDR